MAGYNADIAVRVSGLEKLRLLEEKVALLQSRFTKLNAAIANLGKFTQPKLNLNTGAAERSIQKLQREINGLNTRTTYVKVRLQYDSRDLNGRGGGGGGAGAAAAAAAAASAAGGAGATAATKQLREMAQGFEVMASRSKSLREMSRELRDFGDSLRDDLTPAQKEHLARVRAVNDAYSRSLKAVNAYESEIRANKLETAALNEELAEMKAKLASLNGVPSKFADELSEDITRTTGRIKELRRELDGIGGLRVGKIDAVKKIDMFSTMGNRLPTLEQVTAKERLEKARARLPQAPGFLGNALNTAGAFAGAYAGFSGIQQLGQSAINRQTADLGLKANIPDLKEYQQAVKAVEQQVKLLGLSQTEATQGFTTAYAALRPLGIQLETINQLQQGFVASSRASGRSVEESTAAWRQLVQAIGKGRLNGDELVSISENAPRYYQELAKTMGVSVGALKDLGEEGKITADILVRAGLNLRDSELGKLDKILQGPQQQIKNLGNAFQNLGVELGRVFGPALGQELKNATEAIQGLTRWVKTLSPEMGKTAVEGAKLVVQLLLIGKALEGLVIAGRVAAYLKALAATQVVVGTTAGGATVAVNGLTAALLRLSAIGVVVVGVKYVVDQVSSINGSVSAINKSEAAGSAAGLKAQYGDKSRDQLQQALKGAQANLANDRKLEKQLSQQIRLQEAQMTSALEGPLPSDRAKLTELQARVKANEARVKYITELLQKPPTKDRQAEIDQLLKGVPQATPDDKDAKAKKEAADKLAAEQRQLQQQLAQNQIALDDQVFKNQQELIRQRYELERQLAEKSRANWALSFTGAGREQAQLINDLKGGLDGYDDRIKELKLKISEAEQKVRSAQAGVGVARIGQTPIEGAGGFTGAGFTAQQLQGATAAASKFTGVANMCSESVKAFFKSLGITLPGVTAWADTVRKAGKTMTDWSQLRAGDIVATGRPGDTPHVGVYTGGNNVFHQSASRGLKAGNYPDLNYFKQGGYFVRPNATASAAATGMTSGLTGQDTVAGALGDVSVAQEELKGLKQQLAELQTQQQAFVATDVAGFVLRSTDAFRSETQALKDQSEQLELRTVLEQKNLSDGFIEAEVKKLDVAQQLKGRLEVLKAAYDAGTISQEAYTTGSQALTEAANSQAAALDANAVAAEKLRSVQEAKQQAKSDAQGIASGITGGIREAIKAAVSGGDVRAAFANALAGLGDRFLEMALRPLEQMLTNQLTQMFSPQTLATNSNTVATYQNTAALTALGSSLAGMAGVGAGGDIFGGISGIAGAIFGIAGSAFGGGAFGSGFNPLSTTKMFPGGVFASGGSTPVNSPVLVGERGPELFVPGQSGGITNAQNLRSMMASEGQKQGGDVTYSPNITATAMADGRQWVTVEQMNSAVADGMRVAAKRGAAEGQARTLDKLRQSPSTRRRVGI